MKNFKNVFLTLLLVGFGAGTGYTYTQFVSLKNSFTAVKELAENLENKVKTLESTVKSFSEKFENFGENVLPDQGEDSEKPRPLDKFRGNFNNSTPE